MGDKLFEGTAQIFNQRAHEIEIGECRIGRQHLEGFIYLQDRRIGPGGAGNESPPFNYFDDQNISVLFRFKDLGTGQSLWAEVEAEMGDKPNTPMRIEVGEKLLIRHGNGTEDSEWHQQ